MLKIIVSDGINNFCNFTANNIAFYDQLLSLQLQEKNNELYN